MRRLILFFAALPAFAAYPNGYTYCKVVTTSHTMVSGASDLINYPLTVILTDNALRSVANGGLVNNSSGYDIGFYADCSGSGAALKWEMESYTPTTGAIIAHVLRPTLSHTADDTAGMYYGGSFSSFQSTASAVWSANYKGVWHLGGATVSGADSTSNGLNLTVNGATATTGKIDGAANFPGSSQDMYSSTGVATAATTNFTMEAWVNPANVAQNGMILFNGTAGSDGYGMMIGGGANVFYINISGISYVDTTGRFGASGTWYHVVVGRGTSGWFAYMNGAPLVFSDATAPNVPATYVAVGSRGGGYYLAGAVDEARIANSVLPAGWIATEYANQSAPGTYISEGAQQTFSVATPVRRRIIGGD